MSARPVALDVSWGWSGLTPDACKNAGVELLLVYCGSGRPSVEWLHSMIDAGIQIIFIFESSTTRAYGGFAAGVEDAQYTTGRIAEVGYPDHCSIVVVAADTPNVSGFEGQIVEYFAGWRSVVGTRTLIRYGPRSAGLMGADLLWGVGTWGFGEGGGPNQPPANPLEAVILQSGNTPGPLPDTDLNWVYVDTNALGGWGANSTPTSPSDQEDNMIYVNMPVYGGGARAYLLEPGGQIVGEWTAGPDNLVFGAPANSYLPKGCRRVDLENVDVAAKFIQLMDARKAGAGLPVQVAPAVDTAPVKAAAKALADAVAALP